MIAQVRTLSLMLLLAVLVAVPAQAREWIRVATPHFEIYSDGYPFETQRWAKKLEWFDTILRRETGVAQGGAVGEPLTVYLLEDGKAVQELVGRKYMVGVYVQTAEGPFLIANRRPGYRREELSGQATLFHEYAHHFMYRHAAAAYPAWYREGFAEYVSTVAFDMDRHYTFGAPSWHRLKQLERRDVPIETLLTAEVDEIEAKQRSNFYAWSWLLTHMLKSDPARARQLDAYLAAFAKGASPKQAASAFGDLAALETQLREYARGTLPYRKSRAPLGDTADTQAETLSLVASRLAELRLQRRVGSDKNAVVEPLEQLAAGHTDKPEVLYELAAARAGSSFVNLPQIEAALARVQELSPGHADAAVLQAQVAMRKTDRAGQDWDAIRQRLSDAIARDPTHAMAHAELFRSYLAQKRRPSPAAYAAIAQAFALQPESVRIRTLYATSLGLRGRFAEARDLLAVLTTDPHRAAQGKRAMATLERMERAARQ